MYPLRNFIDQDDAYPYPISALSRSRPPLDTTNAPHPSGHTGYSPCPAPDWQPFESWSSFDPSYYQKGGMDNFLSSPSPSSKHDYLPSPSDTCSSSSSMSTELTCPPSPFYPETTLHVVCDIPLVAPKPLPYHSPTFLQFDLLPDENQDLSRPPYTCPRPTARKRPADEEQYDDDGHDHRRYTQHYHPHSHQHRHDLRTTQRRKSEAERPKPYYYPLTPPSSSSSRTSLTSSQSPPQSPPRRSTRIPQRAGRR